MNDIRMEARKIECKKERRMLERGLTGSDAPLIDMYI